MTGGRQGFLEMVSGIRSFLGCGWLDAERLLEAMVEAAEIERMIEVEHEAAIIMDEIGHHSDVRVGGKRI